MEDEAELRAKPDHDLIILAVQRLGHTNVHLVELTERVGQQNGRIADLEKTLPKDLDTRLVALEHWRIAVGVMFVFIGSTWPLLIYEVRQFVLEKFGFIPAGFIG